MPLHDEVQLPNLNRPKRPQEPPQAPQAPRTEQPAPDAADALALTRQAVTQSTHTLQNQALSLATRIQEGDRALAKQIAGFLANRPNQFSVMLAQEIQSLMGTPETAEMPEFIDVSVAEAPALTLPSVDSTAVAALGMAR